MDLSAVNTAYTQRAVVRVQFSFTRSEVAALYCTGDVALEVDSIVYGLQAGKGQRSWATTLPGAYLDTEASDDPSNRNLSVGTTTLNAIQADHLYSVSITVDRASFTDQQLEMYLNFQRGHWAANPLTESPACIYGIGTPEWCVFATQTVRMKDEDFGPVLVSNAPNSLNNSSDFWGKGIGDLDNQPPL